MRGESGSRIASSSGTILLCNEWSCCQGKLQAVGVFPCSPYWLILTSLSHLSIHSLPPRTSAQQWSTGHGEESFIRIFCPPVGDILPNIHILTSGTWSWWGIASFGGQRLDQSQAVSVTGERIFWPGGRTVPERIVSPFQRPFSDISRCLSRTFLLTQSFYFNHCLILSTSPLFHQRK